MNDSVTRVAVVGAGAFGRNHARVYRQLEAEMPVRLAAIVDANLQRAETVAREFGGEIRAYASVDDLLRAGKIDAASVAAPTSEHQAIGSKLMEAGVDVLIEKPVAASLAEADKLIAAARRTGRIAQVGHL